MATTTAGSDLQELERQTFEEIDGFSVPPADLIAYNELRSCADLYRMYRERQLEISPEFQREIVWSTPVQTRFIDSLVKQLPIPTMCFSLDYKTQKWQVIDGLQRMWSIIRFLNGDKWRLSSLDDVDPAIAGQWVPNFLEDSKLQQYYSRVQNLSLPITVIRCDYSKIDHMDYLFTIFHRLNAGGFKLNNQEIRNCIYSGKFNDCLRDIDRDPDWLKMTGRSSSEGDRYRGQERILRFFAFHDSYQEYQGGLATFLNDYMRKHREPDEQFLDDKNDLFHRTFKIIFEDIFESTSDGLRGVSVLEAVLVGVSRNLANLETLSREKILEMYNELLTSDEFSDEKLREGLSGRQRVLSRLSTAERVFSGQ